MPNMRLPFTVTNPAPTAMALDHAVFEGGYSDSTSALVDADVADGNRGFALHGDVANALDYNLRALALVMGTDYKARPMHAHICFPSLVSQFMLGKWFSEAAPQQNYDRGAWRHRGVSLMSLFFARAMLCVMFLFLLAGAFL